MTKDELQKLAAFIEESYINVDYERGGSCNGCGNMMDSEEERACHKPTCTYTAAKNILTRELQSNRFKDPKDCPKCHGNSVWESLSGDLSSCMHCRGWGRS